MTWNDFWNALKSAWTYKNNYTDAVFNGDLDSDGGLLDQLKSGELSDMKYADQGARALDGVSPDGAGALGAYQNLISSGGKLSADQQEAFNNLMATEATNNARAFEEHMRDTDISSSASQLQALGLSPSGLAGAVAGHSGAGTASVGHGNPALDRYNQKMAVAKSLVGLVGSMASSGITGANMIAARKMAAQIAASTAHTAKETVNFYNSKGSLISSRRTSKQWM